MAGDRRLSERAVERGFERSRLEDQLWAAAYEQIWPVVRRR